jgi:(E)-4-hydroxy-3-methylbut-2-enyl-diphosphate synthase
MKRRGSKQVRIGRVEVGGDAPISIQSMAKTDTRKIPATVNQIKKLQELGCEIVRVAVLDRKACQVLAEIKNQIEIPLVADIHFDYKLALAAIANGADGIRINPGNIGARGRIVQIAKAALARKIPIRVGVNSGSLDRERYHSFLPEAMVASAEDCIRVLEESGFYDIIISLKASDVLTTIRAYQLMASRCDYPFHLGMTAAGLPPGGTIRSAIGIGALLAQGIGDTIRVSLTGPPEEEIRAGWEILKSLGLRTHGIDLISCPTCGRCEIDLIKIAREVRKRLARLPVTNYQLPVKVAVMGCVVNGPGEAEEADIGIAGGRKAGILFKKGKILRKVKESDIVPALLDEVEGMIQ